MRFSRRETGLSPPVKYFTDRSKAVLLLWIFYVFVLSCVCYVFVHVCLYVRCGHLLGKGWHLGSRLWCLTVSLSLSHWYPGSGVVLDCIDSWSLHPYLLWCHFHSARMTVEEFLNHTHCLFKICFVLLFFVCFLFCCCCCFVVVFFVVFFFLGGGYVHLWHSYCRIRHGNQPRQFMTEEGFGPWFEEFKCLSLFYTRLKVLAPLLFWFKQTQEIYSIHTFSYFENSIIIFIIFVVDIELSVWGLLKLQGLKPGLEVIKLE